MSILHFEALNKSGAPGWSPATATAADDEREAKAGERATKAAGCFDCVIRRRVNLDTEISAERNATLEAYLVKRASEGIPEEGKASLPHAGDSSDHDTSHLTTLAPASPLPSWRDDNGVVVVDSSGDEADSSNHSAAITASAGVVSRKTSRDAHEMDDDDATNAGEHSKRARRMVHFTPSSTDIDTQQELPIAERVNEGGCAEEELVVVVAGSGAGSGAVSQSNFRSSSSLMRKATPFPLANRLRRKRTTDRLFSTRADGDYDADAEDEDEEEEEEEDIDTRFPISATGARVGTDADADNGDNGDEHARAGDGLTDDIMTVELSEFGDSEFGGSIAGDAIDDGDVVVERVATVSSFSSSKGSFKSRKLTPYPGERPSRKLSKEHRMSSKFYFNSRVATIDTRDNNDYDDLESMLERIAGSTADEDDNNDALCDADDAMPVTPASATSMASITEEDVEEASAPVINKRKIFLRNFTSLKSVKSLTSQRSAS